MSASTIISSTPDFYCYPGILGEVLTENYLCACRSIGLAERLTMRGLVNLVAYAQVIDSCEGQGATRLLLASLPDPVLWPHVAGQRATVVLFGSLGAQVHCDPAPMAPLGQSRTSPNGWSKEARDADQPPMIRVLEAQACAPLERAAIEAGAHPDLILIAPAWPNPAGQWDRLVVRCYALGAVPNSADVLFDPDQWWGAGTHHDVQAHWCRAWWRAALDLFDAGHSIAQIAAHWMPFDNRLWLARALERTPRTTSRTFARYVAASGALVRHAQALDTLYPKENP